MDGTHLHFYGEVTVEGRIGKLQLKEKFIVGQICDDVILGMSFLVSQGCIIHFGDPILELGGVRLACTDRKGRPLKSGIQANRTTLLLLRQEKVMRCNLASPHFPAEGLVESVSPQILVATTLSRPSKEGELYIRCLNSHDGPVRLPAGCTLGVYSTLDDIEVWTGGTEAWPTFPDRHPLSPM